jgi:hypothetical protein
MVGEIRQAMTQFKVLDLDIGKETEDRQEIVKEAARALNEKIIFVGWPKTSKPRSSLPEHCKLTSSHLLFVSKYF